jgi:Icc-related predicted phosphoesterase
VRYLEDQFLEVDGVRIWGSPWQPTFCNHAFNLDRGVAIRAKWDLIPEDLDILVTHGPPRGVLDRVGREHVGCADLAEVVTARRPRLHVFGHIHTGYGTAERNGTLFVNAAICKAHDNPANAPIVVDLDEEGARVVNAG